MLKSLVQKWHNIAHNLYLQGVLTHLLICMDSAYCWASDKFKSQFLELSGIRGKKVFNPWSSESSMKLMDRKGQLHSHSL